MNNPFDLPPLPPKDNEDVPVFVPSSSPVTISVYQAPHSALSAMTILSDSSRPSATILIRAHPLTSRAQLLRKVADFASGNFIEDSVPWVDTINGLKKLMGVAIQ